MTGTQLVSNKHLFETLILFGKAFPMLRLPRHPQNKFVSTSNHYTRQWKYLTGGNKKLTIKNMSLKYSD